LEAIGSDDWNRARFHLPAGAQTAEQLFAWQRRALDDLFGGKGGGERLANLRIHCENRIEARSHYSAKGTFETATVYFNKLMILGNIYTGLESDCDVIFSTHACDIDGKCRDVLRSMRTLTGAPLISHVFGAIETRLSNECQMIINDYLPAKTASNEDWATAIRKVTALIDSSLEKGTLFAPGYTCYCYVHWRPCPIMCRAEDDGDAQSGASGDSVPCAADKKRARLSLPPSPFTLWMAGTPCIDFSNIGQKRKENGPMMVGFLVWIAEIQTLLPDMIIFEITLASTKGFLEYHLGEQYAFVTFPLSQCFFGFPAKRPRRFIVAYRIDTVSFVGDPREFSDLFEKRVDVTGDSLLLDTDYGRASEMRALAEHRRNYFQDDDLDIPLEDILPPQNLRAYFEHKEKVQTDQPGRVSSTGAYIADLDQAVSYRYGSPFVPTLVTHGKVVDFKSDRMFTSLEHLAIQGEDVFAIGDHANFPCLIAGAMATFSPRTRKRMAGNAVHLQVLGVLLLYALSCARRVDFEMDSDIGVGSSGGLEVASDVGVGVGLASSHNGAGAESSDQNP
jgi:site-specific DNA-cytosine methylase